MQNPSVIKGFTNDRVAALVTLGHLIGPPHQQIEDQMPALEWHHLGPGIQTE